MCYAKVPDFKVAIGGKMFIVDARDQFILWVWVVKGKGFSGTQDSDPLPGGELNIL